jgi:drug/metabolite transporter (DMT)-like permease
MGYAQGVALVLVAGLLWSAIGIVIRLIDEADSWQILFWRSVGMAPVLAAFIAWRTRGRLGGAIRAAGWTGAAGGLGLVLAFFGGIHAIQSTTIANAVFLFAISPLLAAGLGWLVLREPVRRATWVAMGVAVCGMAVMLAGGLAVGALEGNLAALLAAFGFAAFTVALRRGRLGDMMPAVLLGALFAIAVSAGVLFATGSSPVAAPRDIALATGMGAGLLAVGMALYTLGSRTIPAAELALLSMVEVLLAPVWALVLLGETASASTLAGGAVVLAALSYNALSGARRKPPLPPLP